MPSYFIDRITVSDVRYPLPPGAGSDAVHTAPEYCLAVTQLVSAGGQVSGTGFALTLGEGNKLVCDAIEMLARPLKGRQIDELMASFGRTACELANHPMLRWLGPHKGVVHLALASITKCMFRSLGEEPRRAAVATAAGSGAEPTCRAAGLELSR
jgi:L-fuconate dehydratase